MHSGSRLGVLQAARTDELQQLLRQGLSGLVAPSPGEAGRRGRGGAPALCEPQGASQPAPESGRGASPGRAAGRRGCGLRARAPGGPLYWGSPIVGWALSPWGSPARREVLPVLTPPTPADSLTCRRTGYSRPGGAEQVAGPPPGSAPPFLRARRTRQRRRTPSKGPDRLIGKKRPPASRQPLRARSSRECSANNVACALSARMPAGKGRGKSGLPVPGVGAQMYVVPAPRHQLRARRGARLAANRGHRCVPSRSSREVINAEQMQTRYQGQLGSML